MAQSRLMKLRLPLTALLTDPSQKRDVQAMLLKDSQGLLASQLIETPRPLKETTTVFGGQKYVTVSLVLPVVGSLIDMYSKEDDDSCLGSIVSFRRQLCRELTTKFRLQRRLRSSTALIASPLDPFDACSLWNTCHSLQRISRKVSLPSFMRALRRHYIPQHYPVSHHPRELPLLWMHCFEARSMTCNRMQQETPLDILRKKSRSSSFSHRNHSALILCCDGSQMPSVLCGWHHWQDVYSASLPLQCLLIGCFRLAAP